MNKCQNCHVLVYSKFSQLCLCQILFELVYSWKVITKIVVIVVVFVIVVVVVVKFLNKTTTDDDDDDADLMTF